MRVNISISRSRLAQAVALTVLLSPPALADDLPNMVVTPTDTPQSPEDVNASTTIITRQEIEQSGAQSLDELLVGVPGVSVANSGGYGKQSSLFMRGTSSNHTLVLIDGVRINTATQGAALIQYIPLDQIERIEVVRGPRSSLYGSDAMGGVIQIFTRKTNKPFSASSAVTVGNQGTTHFQQFLGGNVDGTRWNLSLGTFKTSGQDQYPGYEPDNDGYDNQSINAGAEHSFAGRLTLGANLYRAQGNTQFDDPYNPGNLPNTDFVQQVLSTHANYLLSDSLLWKTQLSRSEDRDREYAKGAATSNTIGRRDTLRSTLDYVLSENETLTGGIERSQDHVKSSVDYAQTGRFNNAVFVQSLGNLGGFSHQLALRYDDNQQFGSAVTGNAVFGYKVSKAFSPYISYGTAFVTPTFVDLYYPNYGNPNLKAEKGHTLELGAKGQFTDWHYTADIYESRIRDMIAYTASYQLDNINKSRIRGAEVSVGTTLAGWALNLAAGYTDAIDDSTDQKLIRRPKWNGNASLYKDFGRLGFRTEVQAQGYSWDNYYDPSNVFSSGQRVILGGFALTNVALTWQARKDLQLEGRVDNLFNRDAVTVAGYSGRSRLVLGTVRYTY